MSINPSPRFQLDLGNIEEEFSRALQLIDVGEVENEVPIDPDLPPEYHHFLMAQTFTEHDVKLEIEKSEQLAKRLDQEEKRSEEKRRAAEERDRRNAVSVQIYEIFEQCFSKDTINKLLKQHSYDHDRVIEELANASTAVPSRVPAAVQLAKTVYASSTQIVFNESKTKSGSNPELSEEQAIKIATEYACSLKDSAKHHYQLANKYGTKDVRCGALTAIAREESKKAHIFDDQVDKINASKVTDSLDLHNMAVDHALRYTNFAIQSVRERRPNQKKLEVITGRGLNSLNGKAILKKAMIQWLNQMKIKYELNAYNPGVVIVNLRSVQ